MTDKQSLLLQSAFNSFLLLLLFYSISYGQNVDTARIINVISLEQQLDSVRAEMKKVAYELQTMKLRLSEGTNIDELLAVISGDEDFENIPEDQRSKRKRVDAVLRAITARPGQLRFNGGVSSVLQWNPKPSNKFTAATGSVNIFAHTSFGNQTLLFIDLEAIGGNGPASFVRSLSTVNGDAGSTQDTDGLDRLNVNEAWVEFSALEEQVVMTAGKIDLTNYFDNNNVANDETSQFINGAFVNSAALPIPGSTPGVRLRTTLFSRFYVQVGIASVDNSGDNIFDQLLKIGGIGFRLFPDEGHEGNIRLYGYHHPIVADASGFGISFDQNVNESATLFGRWNENTDPFARWYGIASAWSGGGRFTASLAGHRISASIAYGETTPVANSLSKEKILEAFVRYQINKWSHLSPHIQDIRSVGGTSLHITIIGARIQFNF